MGVFDFDQEDELSVDVNNGKKIKIRQMMNQKPN